LDPTPEFVCDLDTDRLTVVVDPKKDGSACRVGKRNDLSVQFPESLFELNLLTFSSGEDKPKILTSFGWHR
jgi:hypothetical protein